MAKPLTITYQSTNYYLVDCAGGKLLVDAGWVGTMPVFQSRLKAAKIALADIRYIMATHYHPDHAGLLQDIKQAAGARAIFHNVQLPFVASFGQYFKGKGPYLPIRVEPGDLILTGSPAALPAGAGVAGEVVQTPGHSADSISLVLRSGETFTGDLTLPDMVEEEKLPILTASWRSLLECGARVFYPAHSEPFPAEELLRRLRSVE